MHRSNDSMEILSKCPQLATEEKKGKAEAFLGLPIQFLPACYQVLRSHLPISFQSKPTRALILLIMAVSFKKLYMKPFLHHFQNVHNSQSKQLQVLKVSSLSASQLKKKKKKKSKKHCFYCCKIIPFSPSLGHS